MTIIEFLNWWKGQLGDLVPVSWYRILQPTRATVTLRLNRDTVTLTGPSGDISADLALPDDNDSEPAVVAQELLGDRPGSPWRLRVILEVGQFLVHRFSMPRGAKGNLAEAVGYQLPKLTPFTPDQVLYACGTDAESATVGPLPVWVVAVPRKRLAAALSLIGQEPPHNQLPLGAPPEAGRPLEIEWEIAESTRSRGRHLKLAWIGMLVLWVGAFSLHLYNRHNSLEYLKQTLSELQTEAGEVGLLRQRLTHSLEQLEWLGERKRSTASSLEVLDSLARLLDDETWLQRLDFDGENLTLTGTSSAPSALVETLENSSSFAGVRFDTFTRDNRNDADRFNLTAKLEQPASGGS